MCNSLTLREKPCSRELLYNTRGCSCITRYSRSVLYESLLLRKGVHVISCVFSTAQQVNRARTNVWRKECHEVDGPTTVATNMTMSFRLFIVSMFKLTRAKLARLLSNWYFFFKIGPVKIPYPLE